MEQWRAEWRRELGAMVSLLGPEKATVPFPQFRSGSRLHVHQISNALTKVRQVLESRPPSPDLMIEQGPENERRQGV
jgi:hypothetical protein